MIGIKSLRPFSDFLAGERERRGRKVVEDSHTSQLHSGMSEIQTGESFLYFAFEDGRKGDRKRSIDEYLKQKKDEVPWLPLRRGHHFYLCQSGK